MPPPEIFAADEQDAAPVDTLRWVDLASAVLEAEGVKGDTELSLLFVDERAMAELNQRYLGRTGPTDVLAFPLDGDDVVASPRAADSSGPGPVFEVEPGDMPAMLGDVVVCPIVARRHADERKSGYDDEMALLIVHGILHLLGMDHVEDKDAVVMERRERELLQRFHSDAKPVPNPEAKPEATS